MKRYIGLLLCVVLIAGCGISVRKRANLTVLENDENWYTVAINEAVSPPYPLDEKYHDMINIPPQTVLEDIEKQLETAGFSKGLASRVDIEANGYDTKILGISLPMKSKTPDEAREVGAVVTALVKAFYADYADTILYELNVFNENRAVTQKVRTVICGNTKFEYTASIGAEKLLLTPHYISESTAYAPVKPN